MFQRIQTHDVKPTAAGRQSFAAALTVVAIAATSAPAVHAADTGMRIVKDPVTGQLRGPTADEFKALEAQEAQEAQQRAPKAAGRAAAAAATPGPVPLRAANGAVGYRVGDAFLTYSVMKRNADGTMTMHCVTGAEAAGKLVDAPQSSTAATDEEHGHAH